MTPFSSPEETSPAPPAEAGASASELETLRRLLWGRTKEQLESLQERVENPTVRAQDVSQVLPHAVLLASARSPQLATALAPAVESALKESVRRDPKPLVNAVFPVLGPAIRKAIAEAFGKLVQSLNQTLDHSLSPRGLKWRIEALRTGRSFGEVVLAHTLVYRVEQVLLIHQHTGLLLLHLQAPNTRSEDASLVSGMLTAIQDFARDSFHVPAGETLHTLQVGQVTVWIEASPALTLAAVIRGQAPYEFRVTLQSALEAVHRDLTPALENFAGDTAPFELARPQLELCLQTQFTEPVRRKPSFLLAMVAGILVLLLVLWGISAARGHRRWAGYLERLRAEPGIVVTEAGKRFGRYFLAGLRDPLAADPAQFLAEFQLDAARIDSRWEFYQALGSPLVLKRAAQALQPPASVTLRFQNGVLFANGVAPGGWAEVVRPRALQLPGVDAFDATGLADATTELLRKIEQTVLLFAESVRLVPGQDSAVEKLAEQLKDLVPPAVRHRWSLRVTVVGHTDQIGTDKHNEQLSRQRADYVVQLLAARGVPRSWLVATGVGERQPWRMDDVAQDSIRNRRVTFRVVLDKSPANPPAL